MGLWSWLTGHDEKESDLYANYDKVDIVSKELTRIATTDVEEAQDEIRKAIENLNNVKGVSNYLQPLQVSAYDPVLESINETINNITLQLQDKAENIKKYEESNFFEKLGSTALMGIFKAGEGLASVAEDLGDGVLSVVGWGAGLLGFKDAQEGIANAIKKEWSHDMFNFYYESDFAKASWITEDSGFAAGFKLVGKSVGYLYAGGTVAGTFGLSNATNLGVGIFKASGTTWAATAVAGLGGLGSGTEAGLNSGKTYNQAMLNGVKTGAINAGIAFAAGKLGERSAKNAEMRNTQKEVADAEKALEGANKNVEAAEKAYNDAAEQFKLKGAEGNNLTRQGKLTNSFRDEYDDLLNDVMTKNNDLTAAKDALAKQTQILADAKTKLSGIESSSIASFQGYNDAVTRAGIRFGEAQRNVVRDSINLFQVRRAVSANPSDPQLTVDLAQAESNLSNSLSALRADNPLTHAYQGTIGNVVSGIRGIRANGLFTSLQNGIRNLPTTAANIVRSPATPGVVGTALRVLYDEHETNESIKEKEKMESGSSQPKPTPYPDGETPNPFVKDNPEIEKSDPAIETPKSDTEVDKGSSDTPPSDKSSDTTTTTSTPPSEEHREVTVEKDKEKEEEKDKGKEEQKEEEKDKGKEEQKEEEKDKGKEEQKEEEKDKGKEEQKEEEKDKDKEENKEKDKEKDKDDQNDDGKKEEDKKPNPPKPDEDTSSGGGNDGGGSSGGNSDTGSHSGGEYGENGYNSFEQEDADELDELIEDEEFEDEEDDDELEDLVESSYTKVPTSNPTIKSKKKKNSIIPIATGLTIAAAAGIGAKAYMDYKKNSEFEDEEDDAEYEDDDFSTEEWQGDNDTVDLGNFSDNSEYFSDDEDADEKYVDEESPQAYVARENEELTELQ